MLLINCRKAKKGALVGSGCVKWQYTSKNSYRFTLPMLYKKESTLEQEINEEEKDIYCSDSFLCIDFLVGL